MQQSYEFLSIDGIKNFEHTLDKSNGQDVNAYNTHDMHQPYHIFSNSVFRRYMHPFISETTYSPTHISFNHKFHTWVPPNDMCIQDKSQSCTQTSHTVKAHANSTHESPSTPPLSPASLLHTQPSLSQIPAPPLPRARNLPSKNRSAHRSSVLRPRTRADFRHTGTRERLSNTHTSSKSRKTRSLYWQMQQIEKKAIHAAQHVRKGITLRTLRSNNNY